MPATIIPFRSRNPETDLLSRRNAEEAKRLLREDGGMDFDRKGLRRPSLPDLSVGTLLSRWFNQGEPIQRGCDQWFNLLPPDGGAA